MMRIIDKEQKEKDKKIKTITNITELEFEKNEIPIDAYVPENENDVDGLDYITENNIREHYVR